MASRAAVTGATGHLGNVLTRELVGRGWEVTAVVAPGEDLLPLADLPVKVVRADVRNQDQLRPALEGRAVVFHLAGLISLDPRDDERLWDVNTRGTQQVVQACREAGVTRLVYTSSVHALVEPAPGGVLDEQAGFDANRVVGAYGRSKAAASRLVQEAAAGGLDAVIVCPTGVLGPYNHRRSAMGQLIARYAQGRLRVAVQGAYDFVDVRDVAVGQLLALEKGASGAAYILTGGRLSMKELGGELASVSGGKAPLLLPQWLAREVAAVAPFVARLLQRAPLITRYAVDTLACPYRIDGGRAERELGFRPRPLKESVRDALTWELARLSPPGGLPGKQAWATG